MAQSRQVRHGGRPRPFRRSYPTPFRRRPVRDCANRREVHQDDPDDPMRTAMRQVIGVFAELDRRMVVKRLRGGRTAKAASGRKAVGAYAYGFHGDGEGRERDAAPNPTEQATQARILEACPRAEPPSGAP
ncbi:recombinase family protein [Streptomyces canus]|uniref:recombinase family protein n=1 Tax=Streptomyces canus TaxID=58343 RepID=UPI0033EAA444